VGTNQTLEKGTFSWLKLGQADSAKLKLTSEATIIYSIIESCQRHHIEPYTCLRDVLTRLPTIPNRQIKDIVPKAWVATRETM
jgi:transposase